MTPPRSFPLFDDPVREWSAEARWLRWLTFLWLAMGLLALFSASYPTASNDFGDGLYYVKRQMIWLTLGWIGFRFCVSLPLQSTLRLSAWGTLILLGVIWLTLIPGVGTTANGANRWIALVGIQIQPSELLKPFLILQAAQVFGYWQRLSFRLRWRWMGIFALVLVGILLQPNLSTAVLCGLTLWMVALAAGLPYKLLGNAALGGALLAAISLSFKAYQRRRILSFLNPWADPFQDGYQLIQSLLAVGSGGTWGTGFGMSQQKLFYLPVQYSDFIFSVYAEEFGLVGGVLLLLLLCAYATLAMWVACKSRSRVHQLVAVGAAVVLVGQASINIGVATGALPTTGLPLPLFSYGGSSAIASMLLAGLLVRVAREAATAEVLPFAPEEANVEPLGSEKARSPARVRRSRRSASRR